MKALDEQAEIVQRMDGTRLTNLLSGELERCEPTSTYESNQNIKYYIYIGRLGHNIEVLYTIYIIYIRSTTRP